MPAALDGARSPGALDPLEHADIELSPYRSWTLKAGRTAGGEPDECSIGGADQSKDRPALVIEVIWTSGGIDKLTIGGSRSTRCEVTVRARGPQPLLPGLDLDLMCTFLDRRSVHIARRHSARRCEPRRNVGYRRARRCWTVSAVRDQLAHRTGSQHG